MKDNFRKKTLGSPGRITKDILRISLVTGAALALVVGSAAVLQAAQYTGGLSYLAVPERYDSGGYLAVYDPTGTYPYFRYSFPANITDNDLIASGDPYGNGFNHIFVAGDETGIVEIFNTRTRQMTGAVQTHFDDGDGFAVGDIDGDGRDEILVAEDDGGNVDIYDPRTGGAISAFPVNFTENDGLAIGKVMGDGLNYILVGGDESHIVDVFDPRTHIQVHAFLGNFTQDDAIAAGDMDGDGKDEVYVAGYGLENVEIFDAPSGVLLKIFHIGYTVDDGFAVGDVDGDGDDEVVTYGDVLDRIDVFDPITESLLYSVDTAEFEGVLQLAVGVSFTDQDDDGLLDVWETFGIDQNGDGAFDTFLDGANPLHKDIYVEVDYMDCSVPGGDCASGDSHNHRPKPAAIQAVQNAFAAAPVPNPDGIDGINLHVDVDDALIHYDGLPGMCVTPDPGDTTYWDVKESHFGSDNPRRFAYHYTVFAHRLRADRGNGGCGIVFGSDYLITLGGWNYDCDPLPCVPLGDIDGDGSDDHDVGSVQQQAATFMHELGHNLGLEHGGGDPLNFKPNYQSIMNYFFSVDGFLPEDPDGSGPLVGVIDYSHNVLETLDENSMDETTGINNGLTNTRYFCPDKTDRTAFGFTPIDWDCDGSIAQTLMLLNVNGDCSGNEYGSRCDPASFDVYTWLEDFDDWSNVRLDFQNAPGFDLGLFTGYGTTSSNIDYATYLVVRNEAPVADAGPDQFIECTGPGGALVTLDGSGSYDGDGDSLTYLWTGTFGSLNGVTAEVNLPIGVHHISLTVTDGNGPNSTSVDEVVVTVQDTTPPDITLLVSPDELWPPNHKLVLITQTVTAVDVCDPDPAVELSSITMDEGDETDTYDPLYDDILGDGYTPDDILVEPVEIIHLRAERSGTGDGRVYTITYTATDFSDNSADAQAPVTVPHE